MRNLFFLAFLFFNIIAFQSCKTIEPAVYPEPVIGDAEFDYWIHSPLHPNNKQEVTFKTQAADIKGITKIELYVYEFEQYNGKDELPSKRRRSDSQWGLVYAWDYATPQPKAAVAFKFARGFRAFSNIEYIFRVYNTEGEVSERLALFDAGDSLWPWDKIMLYSTSRTHLSNSINLCLFPDVDYKEDWRGFLTDMEKMIYDGFHQNNKIKSHKENWQFYYTQHEADGFAISQDFYEEERFPSFIKNSEIQGMDAYGLMHKNAYSDGAYLKRNIHFLSYNLFTSESYNFGTAIHEAAHAIFNLSDEYDLCACFEHPDGANMFSSLKKCQAFNAKNNFPISDCTPLKHLNGQSWYMSEPDVLFANEELCEAFNKKNGYAEGTCESFKDHDGESYYRALLGLCIMQDDGDEIVRNFQRTCSSVIDDFYDKLNQQVLTANYPSGMEEIENMYGYEPIVLMELLNQEDKLAFKVKGLGNGIPKKNIIKRDAIQLDFLKSDGVKCYSVSLPEPEYMHVHNAQKADETIDLPSVSYTFSIPYQADLQTMICAQHPPLNDHFTTKGSSENEVAITKMNLSEPLKKIRDVVSNKE